MKRMFVGLGFFLLSLNFIDLQAHCQMPCGIYHDDLVYDQVDQYVETMYKGLTMLNDSKFDTVHSKNEFVRWVINKEKSSDEVAQLLTSYFLQQKIKPGEEDTDKRLRLTHRLLVMLVLIKQNTDRKFVEDFSAEWDKFKLMFHIEGYECELEKRKLKQREEALKAQKEHEEMHKNGVDHSHDAEHKH